MPAVQVKKIENVPPGLSPYTFPSALCARFRYIGQHHYFDISPQVVMGLYEAIDAYHRDENAQYRLLVDTSIDRRDKKDYDGFFCKAEWLGPVAER
jgi:AraC family transcriptional regulator